MSSTPPPTSSRRTSRSPVRARCSRGRLAAWRATGRRGWGCWRSTARCRIRAGRARAAMRSCNALWWLIVELADERPLALFLDDAQWADDLTLRLLRTAARRVASCRSRSSSPRGRRDPVTGTPAWPPSARLCGSSRRRSRRPAPRDSSRRFSARPGIGRGRRAGARRDRWQSALSAGAVSTGPRRRRRRSSSDEPPAAAARPARRRSARPADGRRGRARERRCRPGTGRRPTAGPRARRARGERGDRRRGGAARRAGARRRRVRLRAPAGRRGGARGDRDSGGGRDACARRRPARRRRGLDDQRVAEHLLRLRPHGDADVVATLRRAAEPARRVGALRDGGAAARARGDGAAGAGGRRCRRLRARAGLARCRRRRGRALLARVAQRAPRIRPCASMRRAASPRAWRSTAAAGRRCGSCGRCSTRSRPPTGRSGWSCWSSWRSSAALPSTATPEALRMIAAEAARATGRTPGERLVRSPRP